MSDITIRKADEADLSEIASFIEEHFIKAEPSLTAYQCEDENNLPTPDEDDNEFIRECIVNGTSFVAQDIQNHLVGIAIAGKIGPNEHEETLKIADAVNYRKFADIMKLLSFIERRADVCNRLQVSESLHLHMISVHKNYCGRGIAGRLFKYCMENAKALDYNAFSVDCTNYYTSKIAERLEMQLMSTVSYDEYNKYVGEILFLPKEPHTTIRSYGLKLNKISN